MIMRSMHGGGGWLLARGNKTGPVLDFSASINPLGPPESLRAVMVREASGLAHYPDPECSRLTAAASGYFGVKKSEVLCGNGSSEFIYALPHALRPSRVVLPAPCYADYARAAESARIPVIYIPPENADTLALSFGPLEETLRGGDMVFIGRPNNPTGLVCAQAPLVRLALRRGDVVFVVDEAFADFIAGYRSLACGRLPNVVALRSMTKFFAIPGLRLGALLGPPPMLRSVRRAMPFWSVNHLAQEAGASFLADSKYISRARRFVSARRQELYRALKLLPGCAVYPGRANFLLARVDCPGLDAFILRGRLLRRGILIRVCAHFSGLDRRFFRVAVRTQDENERLLKALADAMRRGKGGV